MEKEIIQAIARLDLIQLVVFGYIGGSVALYITVAIALFQWVSNVNKQLRQLFEQISNDALRASEIMESLNSHIGILTTKLNAERELREQHESDQEKLCDERHK